MPQPRRKPSLLAGWIWLLYAGLLAVAIPWYWPPGDTTIWLGMPAWATTAVVTSVALSLLTALLLRFYWPETDEDPEDNDNEDNNDNMDNSGEDRERRQR